jgi:molecular chaperone DnaJ
MSSMATKTCYYELLQVSRSATEREISTAYRKMAIKYHPDSNPDDENAKEKFKACAEAYEILSNAEKRAAYDRYGHDAFQGGGGSQFTGAEDIFEAFGDLFGGGVFGDLFRGGGGGGGRRVRRGEDIRCDVTLTLEEAATGVTRMVDLHRHEACETCDGTGGAEGAEKVTCETCGGHGRVIQTGGIIRMQTTCPACQGQGSAWSKSCGDCRGSGRVRKTVKRRVPIPAGVDDGTRMRITGEGEPSPNGGPPGDCYCFISVEQHSVFERDGAHLIVRFPITYPQAALGATVQIPTLKDPKELVIPAGTQTGEVFPLKGCGMPDPHGRGRGDLLVQTYIETQKKLTERQEELLRELAELDHHNVSPQRKSFMATIKDYLGLSETKEEKS